MQRPNFSAIAHQKAEAQKPNTYEKAYNVVIFLLVAVLLGLLGMFMMQSGMVHMRKGVEIIPEPTSFMPTQNQKLAVKDIENFTLPEDLETPQPVEVPANPDLPQLTESAAPIIEEPEVPQAPESQPQAVPKEQAPEVETNNVEALVAAPEEPKVEIAPEQVAFEPQAQVPLTKEEQRNQEIEETIVKMLSEQLNQSAKVVDIQKEIQGSAIFIEEAEMEDQDTAAPSEMGELNDEVPIRKYFVSDNRLNSDKTSFIQKSKAKKVSSKYQSQRTTTSKSAQDFLNRPDIDHHEYRYFELSNKMKVLLVRDPGAQMSEAALNVLAGSYDEPSTFPGLAHFLEHMLFEGSQTYPQPEYFDQLVASKGGETNAYTENSNTNFYFSVDSETLERALTVFAHFFIDPLLNESQIEKEVNAVDSEYEIDVSTDAWKLMHLVSLLSDSKHPQSRFTIGNKETLDKEGVMRALKDFYRNHYSSNNMALVIRTNQDLDRLTDFLNQSDMAKVEDGDLIPHDLASLGLPIKEKTGSVVKFNTDSASKQVVFGYQLPAKTTDYHTKSLEFIDSLITSSQAGSLRDYIIKEDLGTGIDADVFMDEPSFQFFLVEVQLEAKNSKPYDQRQLAYRLAKICNNYFQMLEKNFFDEQGQPTEYLKEMWNEQASLSQTKFRYMQDGSDSPLNDIFFLSNSLNVNPLNEVLSGDFLMSEFNPEAIKTTLQMLVNAENMVIFVGDSDYYHKEKDTPVLAHQTNDPKAAEVPVPEGDDVAVENPPVVYQGAEVTAPAPEGETLPVEVPIADLTVGEAPAVEIPELAPLEGVSFLQVNTKKGSATEDLKFLENNQVKNKHETYHLQYQIKKMESQTIKFIGTYDELITSKFQLPQKNDFIPKKLELVTTCVEQKDVEANEILADGQLHIRLDAQNDRLFEAEDHADIYSFLDQTSAPETITLQMSDIDDTIEMIQLTTSKFEPQMEERLNMFIVTDPVAKEEIKFSSYEECKRKELEFDTHQQYAQLIQKKVEGKVWWKIDRTYQVPAIYAGVRIDTARTMKSARDQAFINLLKSYVSDQLKEELNTAFESGYDLDLNVNQKSLTLVAYGWSEQFERFFTHALDALNPHDGEGVSFLQVTKKVLSADEQRFQRVKADLMVEMRDSFENALYDQAANMFLPMILQHPYFSPTEQYKHLKDMEFADLVGFRRDFFRDIHYSTFFAGNIAKQQAMDFVDIVKDSLHYDVATEADKSHSLQIIDLKGKSIVYAFQSKSSDENDLNGVTLNYYQIGKRTEKQFALMATLQGLLQAQAYSYLRTKKQLGYIVSAQFRPMGCIDGVEILVQGSEAPPHEVNGHIEYFLEGFQRQIQKMTDKFFSNLKEGAIASLRNEPKSLYDEGQGIWSHIARGDLAFEEKEAAAVAINKLTKHDLFEFYEKAFRGGKMSVQIYGKGMEKKIFDSLAASDFKEHLSEHTLSSKQTYAHRSEKIVFSNAELASFIDSAYSCDYRLGGL